MARTAAAAALAIAVLLPAAGVAGPLHADDTLERYFRVEWAAGTADTRGPEIAGYVENVSNFPFDRMRLVVERLDGAGSVVGASTTWVMGVVSPRHRNHFTTRVPAAAAYRVRVLSFDWANCRD